VFEGLVDYGKVQKANFQASRWQSDEEACWVRISTPDRSQAPRHICFQDCLSEAEDHIWTWASTVCLFFTVSFMLQLFSY
jgi:hypothetical protein